MYVFIKRLALVSLALGAAAFETAAAQHYPSRPIALIIPFSAGGPNDIAARLVSEELSLRLGQPVVVDNRPGASGNIAALAAAKAAPDGYTLFWAQPATHGINPVTSRNLQYDPQRDFTPISMVGHYTIALVANFNLPAASIPELIAVARKQPGKFNFGSPGYGTTPHMAGELLKTLSGIELQHVPYRTTSTALQDILGGRIELLFDGVQSLLPHIETGAVRALGVSTEKRSPVLPNVPAIAETLPGYSVASWFGVAAPASTPKAIVDQLNAEINNILKKPELLARFEKLGIEIEGSSPEEMAAHVRRELERWRQVAAATGVTPRD